MSAPTPVMSTPRLDKIWGRGKEFLGTELPIMCGAMTWISDPHLVSRMSNLGAFGVLAAGNMPPELFSEYVIETLVEILEIGLSMLANTISFIRVGAFALSHAGLSIVTYTLAGMFDSSMTSMGAIAIITIGNIFIIGFEGFVCGIQSLRLEYYEFFSKFFRGGGVAFTPFTLKVKKSEV